MLTFGSQKSLQRKDDGTRCWHGRVSPGWDEPDDPPQLQAFKNLISPIITAEPTSASRIFSCMAPSAFPYDSLLAQNLAFVLACFFPCLTIFHLHTKNSRSWHSPIPRDVTSRSLSWAPASGRIGSSIRAQERYGILIRR